MNSKFTKIISTVAVLATVGIMMFYGSGIKPNINKDDVYSEDIKKLKPIEEVSKDEEGIPEVEPPKFVFDTYIPREINSDDYVESKEDIVLIPESTALCNNYPFSSGFAVNNTTNLKTDSWDDEAVYMVSEADNSARIIVGEVSPLSNTIHQLRNDSLEVHGFDYYPQCKPLGIPVDVSEKELDEEWKIYFEITDFAICPLESGMWKLLTDDIIKTAFGNALYVEYKNMSTNTYDAEAYILCDRDRILSIKMSANNREYFYEYLIELTNEGIMLIK